jgi:hypothetical protein
MLRRLILKTGSFILLISFFDFESRLLRLLNAHLNSISSLGVDCSVVLSTSNNIFFIGVNSVSGSLLILFLNSVLFQTIAASNACAVRFFSVKRFIRVFTVSFSGNVSFILFVISSVILL